MPALSIVFRILGGAASVYMLLCIARIFLTWFPGASGAGARFLERSTEPYLALFRRLSFLRGAGVDFSPIAALAVLAGLSRALTVASMGTLTLGIGLALVVQVIWDPVGFLLGFFAVLILARIIAYLARWNSLHPVWRAVDAMINPILFQLKRLFYRNRIVHYMQGLVIGLLVLAGLRLLLGWMVSGLLAVLTAL